jgi:hypothetical protein
MVVMTASGGLQLEAAGQPVDLVPAQPLRDVREVVELKERHDPEHDRGRRLDQK